MKITTEVEIKVGGEILGFTKIGNGTYRFVIETEVPDKEQEVTTDVQSDVFVLVEASKLSLDDEFMNHKPTTESEEIFKEMIKTVIQKGIKDFYRPKYDPSFNEERTGVTFKAGEMPARGKYYNWWENEAKKFMPARQSRLGTKLEYVAFLGVLIKKLVEDEKWSVAKAWNAVCNNSKELGHYWNSENAKHDFEDTGMREICGFFDLANIFKLLAEDEDDYIGDFWVAGGYYSRDSSDFPLANIERYGNRNFGNLNFVGWFVLSK